MSNLQPNSDGANPVRALLSIRPKYAAAILNGNKKYELRRTRFSRHVDIVVIYVTAPVQKVVGEFDVIAILSGPVKSLWEKTQQYADTDEDAFFSYFKGLQNGYAIQIGEVRRYEEPFCPIKQFGIKPPQSFVYLKDGEDAHWPDSISRPCPAGEDK